MTQDVQYNDDAIDAALEAYNNLQPESIDVFRKLGTIDAAIVIRVLKASSGPEKGKVGRPRGSRNRTPATKPNGAAQPQAS